MELILVLLIAGIWPNPNARDVPDSVTTAAKERCPPDTQTTAMCARFLTSNG